MCLCDRKTGYKCAAHRPRKGTFKPLIKSSLEIEIDAINAEIKRIQYTFPPGAALVLIKDLRAKLNSLTEQACPF